MKEYDIILRPIMSEKSYDGITAKRYVFEVDRRANKIEIKNAVEKIFGVEVERVNTSHIRGKLKKQGRTQGYTSARKKAVVQLTAKSRKIEFFENLA